MRSPTRLRSAVVGALVGLLAAFAGPGVPARAAGAPATAVGDVTGLRPDADVSVYRFAAGPAQARVSFVSARTFRLEPAPDGRFTDPTGDDIVLPQGAPPKSKWAEKSDRYELSTARVTLRAYKKPLRSALHRHDGTRALNGRGNASHRGKEVEASVGSEGDEGGHPDSVPFSLSSAGYGVFRNAYAPTPTTSPSP